MTDAPRSGLALDELSAEIRPQDDLFRHVNGAWLEHTEIPEDKARWGSFHLIAEQAEKDVHAIVEESQKAEPGTEARKIGDLYTSFMDTDRIAALGAAPLADQLARVDAIDSIASFLRTVGEPEPAPRPPRRLVVPALDLRVLVVEDNPVNQLVATGLLEAIGVEVDVADDGGAAIAALAGEHPYALVLMDCRMPGIDGFDATRAIRASEAPASECRSSP